MVIKTDAKAVVEKWGRRLRGATEDIRLGVEQVTVAPTAEAVKKKSKWVNKMTSKEVQDKWAERTGRVTLEEWKKSMTNVGIGRISAGVDAEMEDYEEFMKELLPYIDSSVKKIEAMPDLTLEDSIARASAFMREMAKFKRK